MWIRNSGMSALLAVLVSSAFVIPAFVPYGPTWRILSDALLTLILLSGIVAIVEHRKIAIVLIGLSIVVIAIRWAEWLIPGAAAPLVRDLTTVLAFVVLASAVGINVFASGHALGDRIFGAIVLYLLIGVLCAAAYSMIDVTIPGAFSGGTSKGSGIAEWFYFSFVTLTTVGYGDVTPVAQPARSVAILEALIGQLYPAIIIARLVSLQTSDK